MKKALHELAGYSWDGPIGPTRDDKTNLRGSLRHDALYQLVRLGIIPESYRKHMDDLFASSCEEDGMPTWRKWADYLGLRWFGRGSVLATERRERVAP